MTTGPHPDPLDPFQNLEPPAQETARRLGDMEMGVAISQAISLKRIADVLEGNRMDSQVASRLISEAYDRAAQR